jgi:DNA repair protein RAD50
LQRKLSTPEYKDVDEEHRVAVIKHETTQMAVRDLEKYHSALDKVRRHR